VRVAAVLFPDQQWPVGPLAPDVNSDEVDHALAAIATQTTTLGHTLSLVVVHRGQIVRELYGDTSGPDTKLTSWSMGKSITNALIGIAVKEGLLSIKDDHLFDEWNNDDRCNISIANLLNMASGLKWVEDYVDGESSDVIEMLFGENSDGDHAAFAVSKQLEAKPGSKYLYSSGTTNIITKVLARALGETTGSSDKMRLFMQSRLFGPLGMTTAEPKFDATGNFVGSSYVFATARDFVRFGYLFLNNGFWKDQQILPDGWVQYSKTPFAHDPDYGCDYGAHWWMHPDDPDSILALGYEGQITWVSPRRNLVLVRLGKTDVSMAPDLRAQLLRIIKAFPLQDEISEEK